MEYKHSKLGIASFIISIVIGIFLISFLTFMVGAIKASTSGIIEKKSVIAVAAVIGFFIIALLLVDIVALGLGIGGLVQKEHKKIFAILGTIFSAITILGTISLIIIGNMMR